VIHMLRVAAAVTEPFHALVTLERFVSGVKSFMFREMMFVFERFVTYVAFVWPLARMFVFVPCQ
jgi:hypothetical protein